MGRPVRARPLPRRRRSAPAARSRTGRTIAAPSPARTRRRGGCDGARAGRRSPPSARGCSRRCSAGRRARRPRSARAGASTATGRRAASASGSPSAIGRRSNARPSAVQAAASSAARSRLLREVGVVLQADDGGHAVHVAQPGEILDRAGTRRRGARGGSRRAPARIGRTAPPAEPVPGVDCGSRWVGRRRTGGVLERRRT